MAKPLIPDELWEVIEPLLPPDTAALRRVHVPEEKIEALKRAILDPAMFSEREWVALELAGRMTESGHAVGDDLWARLLEHFEQDETLELVAVIITSNV